MRKALSVLALTGGTTTVALAADVPATTPHQLSHPAAAANASNDADKTGLVGAAWSTRGQPPHAGDDPHVFLFFSNRLGCLSSLLLSAVLTVVLLVVLGVILRPRFNIVSTRLLGGGGCVTNGTGSAHGEPGTAPARVSPAGDAACSAQEVAMSTHLVIRTLHNLGLAAWTGGSLMGAIGLNGAASALDDPSQRC
jgi:hypothetical protein